MKHHNRNAAFDRNRYYRLLRVGQKDLGWDDAFYYGIFLPQHGAVLKDGRYSATTLSNTLLFSAVEAMKDKGVKVTFAAGYQGDSTSPGRRLADDRQSKKICALWLELHGQGKVRSPSEESLCVYVRRQTGIDALQWLDNKQAARVIEALKAWLKRPAK